MAIQIASNFDVKTALPLDSRTVVETYDDLTNVESKYEGMKVYVKEDKGDYQLLNLEDNIWVWIGTSEDYVPVTGGNFTGSVTWIDDDIGSIGINSQGIDIVNNGSESAYISPTEASFKTGIDYLFSIKNENILFGMTSHDHLFQGTSSYGNFVIADSTTLVDGVGESFIMGPKNTIYGGTDSTYYHMIVGRGLKLCDEKDRESTLGMYTIFGSYNEVIDMSSMDYDTPAFIFGVGTSDTDRKNGMVLYPDGNMDVLGDIKLFAGTNNEISSLKNYIDSIVTASNGLRYKGSITASSTSPGSLTPPADTGDLYIVSSAGYINGHKVEVGDMVICNTDGTVAATSSNYNTTTIKDKWNFIQANIDVMIGATSSKAGQSGLVPTPTTTDTNKYLKGDGTWSSIDLSSKADIVDANFEGITKTEDLIVTGTTTCKGDLIVDGELDIYGPTYLKNNPTEDTHITNKAYVDNTVRYKEYIVEIPVEGSTQASTAVIPAGALITKCVFKTTGIEATNNLTPVLNIKHDTQFIISNRNIENVKNDSLISEDVYIKTKTDSNITVTISNWYIGLGTVYIHVVDSTIN